MTLYTGHLLLRSPTDVRFDPPVDDHLHARLTEALLPYVGPVEELYRDQHHSLTVSRRFFQGRTTDTTDFQADELAFLVAVRFGPNGPRTAVEFSHSRHGEHPYNAAGRPVETQRYLDAFLGFQALGIVRDLPVDEAAGLLDAMLEPGIGLGRHDDGDSTLDASGFMRSYDDCMAFFHRLPWTVLSLTGTPPDTGRPLPEGFHLALLANPWTEEALRPCGFIADRAPTLAICGQVVSRADLDPALPLPAETHHAYIQIFYRRRGAVLETESDGFDLPRHTGGEPGLLWLRDSFAARLTPLDETLTPNGPSLLRLDVMHPDDHNTDHEDTPGRSSTPGRKTPCTAGSKTPAPGTCGT